MEIVLLLLMLWLLLYNNLGCNIGFHFDSNIYYYIDCMVIVLYSHCNNYLLLVFDNRLLPHHGTYVRNIKQCI